MMMKTNDILEFETEHTTLKDEIKEMWVEKEIDEKQLLKELSVFAEQIKQDLGPAIKSDLFNSVSLKPIKKTWWQKTKELFKTLKQKFDRIFIYNYTDDEIDFFKNEKNYY